MVVPSPGVMRAKLQFVFRQFQLPTGEDECTQPTLL